MKNPLSLFRPRSDHEAFSRSLGCALLVIVGLYVVYDVGVFIALGSEASVGYRVLIMLAMAAFPLPVLFAPATFFAALDAFDLYGERGPGVRARHWKLLGLLALGAYLVVAAGPVAHDYAVAALVGPTGASAEEGMVADPQARLVVPFAVALFVAAGGLAGALTGRATAGLTAGRRTGARWGVCLAMFVSFLLMLVAVADLITMRGILSPLWLALAPPAVSFTLAGLLTWRESSRFFGLLFTRLGQGRRAVDAEALAEALRRTAAPGVAVSDGQVESVVRTLATTPSPAPPGNTRLRSRSWHRLGMAVAFAGAWATVSTSLLLLGGGGVTPPTMASGTAAGLFAATFALSCHLRSRAPALVRMSP